MPAHPGPVSHRSTTGHPVLRLERTSIGPIKLGHLCVGRHRRLNLDEVGALFKLVEGEPNRGSRARR